MSKTISAPAAPPLRPGCAVRLTAARAEHFILELAATGNVREAARRSRTARASLYRRRAGDAGFAAAWDTARLCAGESGDGPGVDSGERIGDLGPASLRLMAALLRAYRDETHDPGPVKPGPSPAAAASSTT